MLQVLCDLLDVVEQMNTQLAGHTHGPTPPPSNAAAFSGNSVAVLRLAALMKSVTD